MHRKSKGKNWQSTSLYIFSKHGFNFVTLCFLFGVFEWNFTWHQVQAILLDPSCSGSGTVVDRLDHLLPSYTAGDFAHPVFIFYFSLCNEPFTYFFFNNFSGKALQIPLMYIDKKSSLLSRKRLWNMHYLVRLLRFFLAKPFASPSMLYLCDWWIYFLILM